MSVPVGVPYIREEEEKKGGARGGGANMFSGDTHEPTNPWFLATVRSSWFRKII